MLNRLPTRHCLPSLFAHVTSVAPLVDRREITTGIIRRRSQSASSCQRVRHRPCIQPAVRAMPREREKRMNQSGFNRIASAMALVGLLVVPMGVASGQTAQTPPDNSKVNTRDRAKGAATADQQKENETDRELTRSIRRALMDDKTLSSYAHNVKVITQGGHVTLKGPVRSEDEKAGGHDKSRDRGRRRPRLESDERRWVEALTASSAIVKHFFKESFHGRQE